MPILQVSDLNVTLQQKNKETTLLQSVHFSVNEGECLGILGESGSGKSMTTRAIMGLLDKNFKVTGSALYEGSNLIGESKEALRRIRGKKVGMVLQSPMTCFDPLYRIDYQMKETFKAHTKDSDKIIQTKCLQTLKKMQIREPEEVLRKYPHQLSGGMLQRIMIGLAMAMEPDLLIADEPTTALDSITQYAVMEEFKRIKKETGTAMIFITHDIGAISCIADRILVLNKGKIVDEGDFSHILNHAQDPYTRLLIEKRTEVMKRYRMAIQKGGQKYA